MDTGLDRRKGYAVAFLLGGVGGGVLVAVATRAIPKMMSNVMSGMMQNMMAKMKEGGVNPSEM